MHLFTLIIIPIFLELPGQQLKQSQEATEMSFRKDAEPFGLDKSRNCFQLKITRHSHQLELLEAKKLLHFIKKSSFQQFIHHDIIFVRETLITSLFGLEQFQNYRLQASLVIQNSHHTWPVLFN